MKATKELIKAATISRVSDKITGKFLGFLVKSNHTEEYYQVTCAKMNSGECAYSCNCAARVECCHAKACREVVEAHKALKVVSTEQTILELAVSQDKQAHEVDEMPVVNAFEKIFNALAFGRIVSIAGLGRELTMEDYVVRNCLTTLQGNGRIVLKEVASGQYFVDTPEQAYRTTFYGDFVA